MNKSKVMNWDELNVLRSSVDELFREYRKSHDKEVADRWCDYFEFVMCMIYTYGWEEAEQIIGIVPMKDNLDDKCVNLDIDGETYRDRIMRQLEQDSTDGVLRIIDTEAHRDFNTGIYNAGEQSGISGLKKQWWTMMDDKVRDSHDFLHGVKVGLDDYFYTDTGDSALFPGGFGVPEQDCNCRCFITLTI